MQKLRAHLCKRNERIGADHMQKGTEITGVYTAPELMENYTVLGAKKASYPIWKMLILGILAGIIIAASCVAASTAVFAIDNVGVVKLISGLLFPVGLSIIMLTGMELFTGNTMITISVLSGKAKLSGMLKNWFFVYCGNFIGAIVFALLIIAGDQLHMGDGALAVYAMKTAVYKCSMTFGQAFAQGILCNILVCLGVLCSLTAKDTVGRILGAYVPVMLFVIGYYEHCVANMYYITVAVLASKNAHYAELALSAGVQLDAITMQNFLAGNLLPVTLGNIISGALIGVALWVCHCKGKKH